MSSVQEVDVPLALSAIECIRLAALLHADLRSGVVALRALRHNLGEEPHQRTFVETRDELVWRWLH